MANGIITLTKTGSANLYGQILWESVSNGSQANSSEVTATIQLRRTSNEWTTTGTWKGKLTVGSKTETVSLFTSVSGEWVTIHTMTATVSHNAEGSGQCYIYGKLDGPTETTMEGTSVSGSATVKLDAIPRYASLVSAPDFHDEENPVITYANPMGKTVEVLEAGISLNGDQPDIPYRSLSKTGSSYTFQLTDAQRDLLRAATTGSNSRQVTFLLHTKAGDEEKTSILKKTFTIRNPEPTLNPSALDSNTETAALTGDTGTLIRYCSNARVSFNAAAVKGAEIKKKSVTCGSKGRTSDGVLNAVEEGDFLFSVTDSRGNTVKKTVTLPMVDYIIPTCQLLNDIPDGSGNMTLEAQGKCFTGSFGAEENTLAVSCRYKIQGGEYGSWQTMTVTLGSNSYHAQRTITGLDYRSAYVFQIRVQDRLKQVLSAEKTVKASPVFDWGESDFSFHVPVAMGGNPLTDLPAPVNASDAVNLGYINGLGLGAGGRQTENLNNAQTTGFYAFSSGCTNAPFGSGVVMVMGKNNTELVQLACNPLAGSGAICIRRRSGSSWGAWEYLNPPLVLGTEYPTVQRHLGKTVYTKLISFGTLPSSGSKRVAHNIPTTGTIVSFQAFAKNTTSSVLQQMPLISTTGGVLAKVQIMKDEAAAYAFSDLSAYEGYVTINYTKE